MIRVRIAPSPTGLFHIGTARTALFNWLFARHYDGEFIVRIEDTDRERSKPEFEQDILDGLRWLGLDWDEGPGKEKSGPSHQMDRLPLYKGALQTLLDQHHAYYCYCTIEEIDKERAVADSLRRAYRYSGRCRDTAQTGRTQSVIRFRIPDDIVTVEWTDLVRGSMRFERETMDDVIIAKSLDEPLYNFAVVVDDAAMGITHVIRGEDHISNTPKQILIAQALGYTQPLFGHFPLILNADRTKMSKRFNNVAVSWYRSQGYLPEAMVNFLALLGWNPGGEQEIYSPAELCKIFDIDRVQKSGAIFNEEKLRWFNSQYLARLSLDEFTRIAQPFIPALEPRVNRAKAIAILRSRAEVLSDLTEPMRAMFVDALPVFDARILVWSKLSKRLPTPNDQQASVLQTLQKIQTFFGLSQEWSEGALEYAIKQWIQDQSMVVGEVLWPLRVALSGATTSPNPFELLEACGRELSLERIAYAIKQLS